MSHKVSIDRAVKTYGSFHAVDHISLDIEPGEFFTLLGPSGCGKTTLLRMIAGFNSIDGGVISFDGQVINGIPASRRNIGMVFQNYAIFPHLSVRDNVAYGLKARKIKGGELSQKTDEIMRMMQIYDYRDRMPSQLSGGQQQRVALARAVVIQPGVLLMDEPLSNLDAKLRVEMRTSIKKIQRQLGITTIYVTHDQEEALAISDRIAVINKGRVMQLGRPAEIYRSPANPFVANFIGTSCFLPGEALQGGVRLFDGTVLPNACPPELSGPVQLSVRPENLLLGAPEPGALAARITMSTFLGDFVNYELELSNGQTIQANEYAEHMQLIRDVGATVGARFLPGRFTVFPGDAAEAAS